MQHPLPGALRASRGMLKKHPAISGSGTRATSGWGQARSCQERGRSKGKG